MTKVFLAAGVAALAIAAPASAGPGGHGGGNAAKADRVQQRAAKSTASVERQRPARTEMRASQAQTRATRVEARQMARADRPARVESRQVDRAARVESRQAARTERAATIQTRQAERQQVRANQMATVQQRVDARQQMRSDRMAARQLGVNAQGQGYGIGGCPPGLAKKAVACTPPGQAAKLGLSPVVTAQTAAAIKSAQVADLNRRLGTNLAAPLTAASLLGMPLSQANAVLPLSAVPQPISYLYPSTPDYYYRYNNGYVYQVDSTSNLINALIPLLAGGYLPGQYLPSSYMNSYVPSAYGYNSFYPDSPYQCTRYANGVVYYVDCATGLIENVQPIYDNGYGVGQLLPSSYSTYNVPYQYRGMYYDTADTGYWYAPGAIYQYDPRSSLITSVAALLSPGMTIGQPMPLGYSAYNVPYAYRDQYYDTADAWYRYNNGYIYQVDPKTQLVSAIVASILT